MHKILNIQKMVKKKKCYKYTKERLQEQAQNGYRSLSEAEKDKKKIRIWNK